MGSPVHAMARGKARDGRIVVNPKVMLGKPVVRGTRITVEILLEKLAAGLALPLQARRDPPREACRRAWSGRAPEGLSTARARRHPCRAEVRRARSGYGGSPTPSGGIVSPGTTAS